MEFIFSWEIIDDRYYSKLKKIKIVFQALI